MTFIVRPRIFFNSVSLLSQRTKKEIGKTIETIIDSGVFLNGDQNQKLEKNLQRFFGSGYATTTASGHDALILALSSLNLSKNDEIIFPVNAYPTAFAACLSKGKPVPVDVKENGQIDPQKLKEKITRKTKAIILVHLYGLVGEIESIEDIIKDKNIFLIEDCAQSFGSSYRGKPVGTFGDISCFSFYPTKNLSTLGDGGALWTRHKNLYEFFLKAKSYGESKRYWSEFISGHSRLPEIQAGVLNLYFENIEGDFLKKKKNTQDYIRKLRKEGLANFVRVLESHSDSNPVLHLFVVEVKSRDGLVKYLKKRKIETLIHYPNPVHLLPAFSFLNFNKGDFPIAERLSKNIVSLPFHSHLTQTSITHVVKSIKAYYSSFKQNPSV